MRKLLAFGMVLLGVIGLSAVLARSAPREQAGTTLKTAGERPRSLPSGATSVRILLGVGDRKVQPWDGKVTLDQGEVIGVEPYRFRSGDAITGDGSWTTHSQIVRKAADKAKKAQRKGTSNQPVIGPAGIIVTLKAPSDATLTVQTRQGEAKVPLSELAAGTPRPYLDGRIEAQSVPPHAPLAVGNGQEDFPAAVSDGEQGAWVVHVDHQSRGPEALSRLNSVPDQFQDYIPKGGGDQIKLVHFDGSSVERALDVTGPAATSGGPPWRETGTVGSWSSGPTMSTATGTSTHVATRLPTVPGANRNG